MKIFWIRHTTSKIMGIDISHLEFIKTKKDVIYNLITDILTYKEYLSDNQLENLEHIRSSEDFHLLKMNGHPLSNVFYSSKEFKAKFAGHLNKIINAIKALK